MLLLFNVFVDVFAGALACRVVRVNPMSCRQKLAFRFLGAEAPLLKDEALSSLVRVVAIAAAVAHAAMLSKRPILAIHIGLRFSCGRYRGAVLVSLLFRCNCGALGRARWRCGVAFNAPLRNHAELRGFQ